MVKEEKITEVETGNVATDVKKEREKRTHRKRPNNKRKIKDQGGPSAPASKQFIRPKRLTLLQKVIVEPVVYLTPLFKYLLIPLYQLLQGEILHERNVILQCVHYIVQQKFFGIGQPDASQSSEPSAPESSSWQYFQFICDYFIEVFFTLRSDNHYSWKSPLRGIISKDTYRSIGIIIVLFK